MIIGRQQGFVLFLFVCLLEKHVNRCASFLLEVVMTQRYSQLENAPCVLVFLFQKVLLAVNGWSAVGSGECSTFVF